MCQPIDQIQGDGGLVELTSELMDIGPPKRC